MSRRSTEPAKAGVTSRIQVDLGALATNYRQLRKRSLDECAGVVKADGYGMGLIPVIETLVASGCDTVFVAALREALKVRAEFPDLRVVLLGGVVDDQAASIAANAAIEPALNSVQQALLWQPHRAQPATVHVDTGMQRLGFSTNELTDPCFDGLNVTQLMTHLACADVPTHPMNRQQLDAFAPCTARFSGVPTSIANSAGCLLAPEWHGNLTRPGIGLYGGHPQNRIEDNPMTPVVSMHGQVIARRTVKAGTPVGYGGTFIAQRTTELAVVGLGYADGLPRQLSGRGEVSVNGVRAPMRGRISMDLTHVDVTELGSQAPDIGDWVEFLGADIGVDEVAQWSGTIGLQILCGLGSRPFWEYVH